MRNAYGSLNGFKSYCDERGYDYSAFSDTSLDQKRLIVSEWIDGKFGRFFSGAKKGGREQIELWPRYNAVDINDDFISSDIVPYEVEAATYEGTIIMESTGESLSSNYTPSEYKRVSIDGAISIEYNSAMSSADIQTQYVMIETLLAPVLSYTTSGSGGLSGPAVRA